MGFQVASRIKNKTRKPPATTSERLTRIERALLSLASGRRGKTAAATDEAIRINPEVRQRLRDARAERGRRKAQEAAGAWARAFQPAQHPKAATPPSGADTMALDEGLPDFSGGSLAFMSSAYAEGQEFLGYPVLSLMAQRAEYRNICKILATQMTRKWIKIVSRSDDGASYASIAALERFMKKVGVRDAFKRAAEIDFFFGRGHLFLEFGGEKGIAEEETARSVGTGDDGISRAKVGRQNPLTALRPVEPLWVYPMDYNTTDPSASDWYEPTTWFVLGKAVHNSRSLTFVGEEVSDLLKPAYSFGGLSKTQIAKPYVDNWLNTRQAVADLVKGFTTYVLKTNLMATLRNGSADDLFERLEMFIGLATTPGDGGGPGKRGLRQRERAARRPG